ncbi:MAG: lysophospholipid acyltransferase family protein [Oligoflexia bacterium]|nr:lysophospholipid acyltransferase family protein [Oligoflexia bacterium]
MEKFIGYLILATIYIIRPTYRFIYTGTENKTDAQSSGHLGGYAVAFLHENLFGIGVGHRGQKYSIMVSSSKDGEIASTVARGFGFVPVRGSSTRGGKKAKDEMLALLKNGVPAALTVDGPKGPRRVCRAGIIDLAFKAKVSILPMIAVASSTWIFHKSWDKFKFPKPFSTIIIRYGKPLNVSALSDVNTQYDTYQRRVIEELEDAEKKAFNDLKCF